MSNSRKKVHTYGINPFRLITIPLVIAFLSILGVSTLGILISRSHLLSQTRISRLTLDRILVEQVKENQASLETINRLMAGRPEMDSPLEYGYQRLVERLQEDPDVVYAYFIDRRYTIIADGTDKQVGARYENAELLEILTGGDFFAQPHYEMQNDPSMYEVAIPLQLSRNRPGMLVTGFSQERVYDNIYANLILLLLAGAVFFVLFYWVQQRNVIRPIQELGKQISLIDVENQMDYRLTPLADGSFRGLIDTLNRVLDKVQSYFFRIKEKEADLSSYNLEIQEAYQQLAVTQERLRVKYDESQSYLENIENLKQKYEIAIRGTGCAVWEINLQEMTIDFTEEFCQILEVDQVTQSDAYQALERYLHGPDQQLFSREFDKILAGKSEEIHLRLRVKTGDSRLKWVLVRGTGIYDLNGKLKYVNGIVMDISKMKKQEEYIEHLAFHDPLTELPNRRKFLEKLKQELDRGGKGVVMLLDLDNFKEINDSLGHVYGDQVLAEIAGKLREIADENLFVSRFGGDEFLFLLLGTDSQIVIEDYIDRIRQVFQSDFTIDGNEININYSMGITLYPQDSEDENQLIANADTAMYHVKNTGRNNYRFFNSAMLERVKDKKEVEGILREAIRKKDFILYYQPQIDLKTGRIASYEALIRLKHYAISPAVFIPIAEETGLIVEIGRWVATQAVRQMVKWRKNGLELKPVAINFSTRQLHDNNYPVFLESLLKRNDIDPRLMEIEITESILLERAEETVAFLNRLKGLGIELALDDFGTGYSSLSYLTFIPVNKIKLDKSLSDRFLGIEASKVVESLITLAHSLGLTVTAEGIERMEHYHWLKAGQCDYIQGYLFSKPLDGNEIEAIHNKQFVS